jgi:hypothetical protein
MMNNSLKDVEIATCKILKAGGQGVLIKGYKILTAAHCIEFSYEKGQAMALGEYHIEEVKISGELIKTTPYFIDPIQDIALLGSLDDQKYFEDFDKFHHVCKRIKAVPICQNEFELFNEFPVSIRSHKSEWISAQAILCKEFSPILQYISDKQIEGGTSGGPIVNNAGELVALVSNTSENESSPCDGFGPRPHLALPVWSQRELKLKVKKGYK